MSAKRIRVLGAVIAFLFAALIAVFASIQFFPTRPLIEPAIDQRLSNMRIEKLRGNISDRNGIPFTNREQACTAFIKAAYMPKAGDQKDAVCALLHITPEYLDNLISKNKPVLIETDKAGSEAILRMNTDWVCILESLDRYGGGTLAKHVIGYLNKKDQVGQAGIEKAYEDELRDKSIFVIGSVTDAAKNPIRGLGYRVKELSADGKYDVRLTLDYHIQKIVEAVMDKHALSGAVVVMDVVTGDVLAMAGRPEYRQDAIENYLNSSGNELFNKATAAYNLGSIFKIVDLAAYFDNPDVLSSGGLIDNECLNDEYYSGYHADHFINRDMYYCEGATNINGLEFKCSSYFEGGHGVLNMERAFAVSCNSYFIDLCQKIGYKKLIETAQKFGLGRQTGIAGQGVGEASGSLPPLNAQYSRADIANLAIGQGVLLATPLQVADMVATVANGGIKNRINIVDSIVDSKGNIVKEIRVKEGRRIISKSAADKIKNMMEAVTEHGTGMEAVMGYSGGAGGKTGSAETGSKDVIHAWFAGYFPAAEPRYSVSVFAENGRYGGKAAAPIFAGIAEEMLRLGY